MQLRRKRALITGSTSGIGVGIAESLAAKGCDLILNGFGAPVAIAELQSHLSETFAINVDYFPADISHPEDCKRMVTDALTTGSIDILVNNAGIQHVAPVEQFPTERWDAILATNLSSAFHLIAATLPAMRERGWGRIINIASVHGLVGSKDKSGYVAAKHGLIGLTKVVALETAGQGITCNAICPGWVMTPLIDAQIAERMQMDQASRDDAEKAMLREKQPSGQFTTTQQLGECVTFLCSDAAANTTGISVPLDGGWTAQ